MKRVRAVREKNVGRESAEIDQREQFHPACAAAGASYFPWSLRSWAACSLSSTVCCEDRVVAVPLHEVRPAHERAVLGGAAVVVPEVEIGELDRLAERLRRRAVRRLERVHDGLGGVDLFVGRSTDGLAFLVNASTSGGVWHCRQMSFILACARSAFGRFCGDFGEQIIREPLGRVVRDAAAVESAHVAGRAGRDEHVARGQAVGRRAGSAMSAGRRT